MDALAEHEAMGLFEDAGIPVAGHRLAGSEEEAAEAAEAIGYPVVLKVDSGDVKHKTDVGAVMTAHDQDEVRKRFHLIQRNVTEAKPDAAIEGILVEERLEGNEMIVGVEQDPEFGPVIMFGLGGIFVEVLRDVNFRAIPITERDARELVNGMEARELLDGVRGNPPADIDAIVNVLTAVSDLVQEEPVEELDINPLFVNADGAFAADALVTMR